jgi:hypothetical protein
MFGHRYAEASLSLTKSRECLIGIRLRLLHCLTLLFDLRSSLVKLDLSVARIQTQQNTALLDVASDIEIHLNYLSGYGRSNIGLRVARQITRRLDVGRDRNDARLNCGDRHDIGLSVRIISSRRVRAAARRDDRKDRKDRKYDYERVLLSHVIASPALSLPDVFISKHREELSPQNF